MKQDLISQSRHFWDVYRRVVTGFNGDEWRRCGEGLTRPDRLAYHIFQSTRFYTKDSHPLFLTSGSSFERDRDATRPGRDDILALAGYFTELSDRWIGEMEGLLNRCRGGQAPDFWVDSLKGIES
ncbi:MAG: hypothetical protein JXA95_19390 [Spirochaetales bacterium]|nr:hypothetical protein [Spirochaetales bacterium]